MRNWSLRFVALPRRSQRVSVTPFRDPFFCAMLPPGGSAPPRTWSGRAPEPGSRLVCAAHRLPDGPRMLSGSASYRHERPRLHELGEPLTDDEGDLGDHGVPETSDPVHPMGNP